MDNSSTKNGVEELSLKSWRDYFDLTRTRFATSPAFVYRGQANFDWPLDSSLDRHERRFPKRKNLTGSIPEFFECPPFSEVEHLNAFRRAIRGRRGANPKTLSDDECWALAQHNGLATPLLDWTRSPFVALFFAFEEDKFLDSSEHSISPVFRGVYALSTSTIEADNQADASVVRIVSPDSDDNYRLISQSGLLIRLPRKATVEDHVTRHFEGETRAATFIKIKIPNIDRHECLVTLSKMGINHMSLFPGIDGAAKHVNSLWQPGHEDSIAFV